MSKIYLCGECYLQGVCRRLTSRIVTDEELTPAFLADVRGFMRSFDLTRDQWKPFLIDAYQNYPGRIVDRNGREAMLDTSVYDLPTIRDWFRYMCEPIPDGITPRLRREARLRFIVTATILRAIHPVPALLWGKDVANDVAPALKASPVAARDACPYPHFAGASSGGGIHNLRK